MTQPWSNQATSLVVIQGGAPGTGLFLYNGAPGPGNPPVLWAVAPGVTADPFGNPVAAVLGAGDASGPSTQIDATGDITLTGVGDNLLQLIPAANLPFSLTTALAGIMEAVALLGSGDASQAQPGVLSGIQLGTGSAAKMGTLITSPYGAGSGMGLLLEATNDGGTDTPYGTFGTVSTQGGTLTFQPVLAMLPYAVLIYGATGALTVVTHDGNASSLTAGNIPIPGSVSVAYGEAWGPTGGGATGDSFGSGAGAEYAAEPLLAVTPGGNAAYSIPAAGQGGAVTGGPSAGLPAAGATTLAGSAVTITANPGAPGNASVQTRAAGGTGSGNTIHFDGGAGSGDPGPSSSAGAGGGSSAGPGGPGTQTPIVGGTTDTGQAGALAPSGGGNGGPGGNGQPKAATVGGAGATPGGGGGQGGFDSPSRAGGRGGAGRVRLTYATGAPTILASFAAAAGTDQFGTAYPAGNLVTQPVRAQDPNAANATAETWHSITTVGGMTINAGGHIAYRLTPDNMVEIEVQNVTTNATADGTTVVTAANGLKSQYRPLAEKRRPFAYAVAKSTVGAYPDATLAFQTDGSIQCYGFAAANRIDGQVRFPLDN
jgi:hypothetical protein